MNKLEVEPLQVRSLKDEFITRFETLILSGQFKAGEKVPSERELGAMFGVSRPVVHEGLRALEGRGLVTIESRRGVRVNDYRREGSIEMLLSILNYSGGKLSPALFDGVLEMRLLFEVETAGLAARRRSPEQLAELLEILRKEAATPNLTPAGLSQLDYDFHLTIALASGNEIYPLLMNSFKRIYLTILVDFYRDATLVMPVFDFHRRVVAAIEDGDDQRARHEMTELLRFGERNLRRLMLAEPHDRP